MGLHLDLKLTRREHDVIAAVQRFGLAERTFVSSYYFGTARAVATHDGVVRTGFTVPRRIFRISDTGRGAPIGTDRPARPSPADAARRTTAALADEGDGARPPSLAGDRGERARGPPARRCRRHLDGRRPRCSRSRGRRRSRRDRLERSTAFPAERTSTLSDVRPSARAMWAGAAVALALAGICSRFRVGLVG